MEISQKHCVANIYWETNELKVSIGCCSLQSYLFCTELLLMAASDIEAKQQWEPQNVYKIRLCVHMIEASKALVLNLYLYDKHAIFTYILHLFLYWYGFGYAFEANGKS